MRTALLTGVTSYLGRALAGALSGCDFDVHAVVRPTSDLSRLDGLNRPIATHVHDGRTETLKKLMIKADPDIVFHLATHYCREHGSSDIEPLIVSNVLFGTQLLEAMRGVGVTRLVNVGSYFQRYDSENYRPLNLYAATKQAYEDILSYYVDAAGLRAITLLLYDVYGPGDWRAKLLSAIRHAQLTGSPVALPSRDLRLELTYIDDVIAALARAAEILAAPTFTPQQSVYSVASGTPVRISEIIALFEEVGARPVSQKWGAYPVPERNIEKPNYAPILPGWRPRVALREGIRRFIEA
jgi:nucleoside-diphosphate-sugar epimerase